MIAPNVKKWLPIVELEIKRNSYPFVSALVLSVIQRESQGTAGAVNPKSGASGLMQVMPATLRDYNKHNPPISLETLRSNSIEAGRQQIKVGLWVLGRFWRNAYKWIREIRETVPLDELAKFGDAFFAAGPARIKGMAKNRRTWAQWSNEYPDSIITVRGNAIWQQTAEQKPTWNLSAVDQWVEAGSEAIQKNKQGFAVDLIILAVASLALKYFQKGKKHESS